MVGPWRPTPGGVYTFQKNLVSGALARDWDLLPYSTSRPPKENVLDEISYRALFSAGLLRPVTGGAITAAHFARFLPFLRRRRIAAVQVQSSDYYTFWESSVYMAMARVARLPLVVRFGGSNMRGFFAGSGAATQRAIRRVLRLPDAIVVQSPGWKAFFHSVAPFARLEVIGNAVDPPPPPPDRHDGAQLRALFVCTVQAKRKGLDTVVEMMRRAGPSVRVVFVAAGDPVRQQLADQGLLDRAEVLGNQDREAMRALYRSCDVLLLPSRSEGFPNTLLEAMAAALPVLAAPVGAIPEVIEDGVQGMLIEHGDGEGYARAVERLARDPQLRHSMGQAGYETVMRDHLRDHVFARYGELWRELIGRRSSRIRRVRT